MKIIGITQRVSQHPETLERRDSLDQRWTDLLQTCNYLPYPIPNRYDHIDYILKLPLNGIILTGGNHLNTDAPERDALERAILNHAVIHRLPILGVCRGMQMILKYFDCSLEKVEGHVKATHTIEFAFYKREVNSFHEYGAFRTSSFLQTLATAEDGVIEAIQHIDLPIYGIMWHPERNHSFNPMDIKLLTNIFK